MIGPGIECQRGHATPNRMGRGAAGCRWRVISIRRGSQEPTLRRPSHGARDARLPRENDALREDAGGRAVADEVDAVPGVACCRAPVPRRDADRPAARRSATTAVSRPCTSITVIRIDASYGSANSIWAGPFVGFGCTDDRANSFTVSCRVRGHRIASSRRPSRTWRSRAPGRSDRCAADSPSPSRRPTTRRTASLLGLRREQDDRVGAVLRHPLLGDGP